jgi:hypothetical protein
MLSDSRSSIVASFATALLLVGNAVAGPFSDPASWDAFDAKATSPPGVAGGFRGVVLGNDHVYFVPFINNASGHNSEVLRYSLAGDFQVAASWEAFDPDPVHDGTGLFTDGETFWGGCFDGQHVYFAGTAHNTHTEMMRYDTVQQFADVSAWAAFDPEAHGSVASDQDGYAGAVYANGYVYFTPVFNGHSSGDAIFLRFDTSGAFSDPAAWGSFNARNVSAECGYLGGVYDGMRYVYFAPYNACTAGEVHGVALRFDTWAGTFNETSAWSVFDAGTQVGAKGGYTGAVFDERYVYFVPSTVGENTAHAEVLRYDTALEFTSPGAWAIFEPEGARGGYGGGCTDGRYIYLVAENGGPGWHAEMMRYDRALPFDATAAWETFDANASGVTDELGFCECVYDGRFVYFGPGNHNTRSGEVLRFESGAQGVPTVTAWGLAAMTLLVLTAGSVVFTGRRLFAGWTRSGRC